MRIPKASYIFLAILMILYILVGVHTPPMITQMMYNGIGPFVLILFVVYMFYNTDVYLTILAILSSLVLVYRTTTSFVSNIPGLTKDTQYRIYNERVPETLEIDMVHIRIPNSAFRDYSEASPFVGVDV
jgi:hypothetical protein